MGTRYFLTLDCPHCGKTNLDEIEAIDVTLERISLQAEITHLRKVVGAGLVKAIRVLKGRNKNLASKYEQEKEAHARTRQSLEAIINIDESFCGKTLEEMNTEELHTLVKRQAGKLKLNQLKREVLGQKHQVSQVLLGVTRRKLKVAQRAIDILNKLQQVNMEADTALKSAKNLQQATQTVLVKWSAVK